MRATREVEGNSRRGDEREPVGKVGKDKEKEQGLTLVQDEVEEKRWVMSKGRRQMDKILFFW